MGFLDWIFKSRDKPVKDYYHWSGFPFLFGRSSSGQVVNETSALQVTAVYACVRLLAESIAGLPLHVYRYTEHGKERVLDHPLSRLLHDSPNPEMTSFTYRETSQTHILLYGNIYSQILRDRTGRVVGLYPLLPNRMEVDRDEDGNIVYTYTQMQQANPNIEKMRVRLPASEVLHIPGLGFDGLVGYSPIAMAKNAIGATMATDEYGSKFFENGARPSGVLKHPTILKDPARVRDSWNAAYGGSSNTGKIAVLEEGMEYQPITIPNNEAQFLETRKFQVSEIARIFRVPPHMIGDLEKATFSNIEQQSIEFVKYTLNPWISRWEQSLNKALLQPSEQGQYFIAFNVDGLLRGDYKSRMEGYAVGIQNGFMSPNDVRGLENMNPIPASEGGDSYLVNGNMMKLSDAGAAYAKKGGNA